MPEWTPVRTGRLGRCRGSGGHHLALNLSVESNRVRTMTPNFVETEPAIFNHNGVDYEAVIDMHLAEYAVFAALSD